MKLHTCIASLLVVAGCATNTGVVQLGPNSFMIAKQAATGFSGLGNLKGEAIAEAATYCSSAGKEVQVSRMGENSPPLILGNYPRAEVQFSCLAK